MSVDSHVRIAAGHREERLPRLPSPPATASSRPSFMLKVQGGGGGWGMRRKHVNLDCPSDEDLSDLSNKYTAAEKAQVLKKGLGTSGRTFSSLMSHIEKASPRMVIMENVDDMEDESEGGNCAFLYECMAKRGYCVSQRTLRSNNYWVPQKRKR
eukprot:7305060-Pyramimonas_sp.AAC.1